MSQRLVADTTTIALEKALDGTALQHRLIANNLANLETPGFVASHARFEEVLRSALADERAAGGLRTGTRASPLDEVQPYVVRTTATPAGPDGNNVDIEAEMTALSESSLRYETLTRLLTKKLRMVGVAIGDGKRG